MTDRPFAEMIRLEIRCPNPQDRDDKFRRSSTGLRSTFLGIKWVREGEQATFDQANRMKSHDGALFRDRTIFWRFRRGVRSSPNE